MPEPTRQPIVQDGDLLTAEEVAALLRVTTAWVYAETRRHRIPHIRLGRYVRYRRDALAAWMDQLEDRSIWRSGVDGIGLNATVVRLGGRDGLRVPMILRACQPTGCV